MNRKPVLVCLVLLILIGSWVLFLSRNRRPVDRSSSIAVELPDTQPGEGSDLIRTPRDEEGTRTESPDKSGLTVFVREEAGSPVPGATLYNLSSDRRLDSASVRTLGQTNEAGVCRIASEKLDGVEQVVVHKVGFVNGRLERVTAGQDRHLVLRQGAKVVLHLSAPGDRPVIAATVALLQRELSDDVDLSADPSQSLAGAGPLAVFHGTSNKDGQVALSGLGPGVYGIKVVHPDYLSLGPVHELRVPGPARVELRLAPLFGALIVAPNDQILGGKITSGKPRRAPYMVDELATRRRKLEQRQSGSFGIVAIGDASSHELKYGVTILLEAGGWRDLEVTLAPWRQIRPTRVTLEEPPPSQPGRFLLTVTSPRGDAVDVGPFVLVAANGVRIPIQANRPLSVPAGRYRIQAEDPLIEHLVDQRELVVESGKTAEQKLGLEKNLVPCRFRVERKGGAEFDAFALGLKTEGNRNALYSITQPKVHTIWLPPGALSLQVAPYGFRWQHRDVVVHEQREIQVIRLTISQ